jgi:hypothetical protein
MTMQTRRISLSLCLALLVMAAACGDRKTGNDGTVGTTGTTAVRVTDVSLGRAIGTDKAVTDSTDKFGPADTIYASVATEGTASAATLRTKWTFEDGQTSEEGTRTIAPSGKERTEFHVTKPSGWPAGKYKVEVFLNDQSAGTKTFEVQPR